jgi:predicted ester cyclase
MPTNGKSEANKAVLRRFMRDLDEQDAQKAMDRHTTPDCLVHFPRGLSAEPLGRDAYVAVAGQIRTAFPDLQHAIESLGGEGDRVWARCVNRGTHRGDFQGATPTGKKIEFSSMTEGRMEGDRIAEMWVEADMVGLLKQLGVKSL